MTICVVVGTRPEIVKMSSIIHELTSKSIPFVLVHTGQHYDPNLSSIFFKELDLPQPQINLDVGSGTQAEQTGNALIRLEKTFRQVRPDLILVEGDTNTVLAGALAGAKLGIKIGHVESGLRSLDRRMPEEYNRRITDHISSYLFAPTRRAFKTLQQESCWGEALLTGNTVIDACIRFGPQAHERSSILKDVPSEQFALATVHRAENVDDPTVLRQFVEIFDRCQVPIVCPMHPRTLQRVRSAGLDSILMRSGNTTILPPLGYLDFLKLLMTCSFVISDSGGVQEEVTSPNVQKKVFVLRDRTERPEAVESGYAEVVGTNAEVVLDRLAHYDSTEWRPTSPCPFGQGDAALRIVTFVEDRIDTEMRMEA